MSEELAVVRAAYALNLELARRVEKFPRHQRAGLGADLTRHARATLDGLIRAKFAAPADRAALLAEVNVGLEVLRFQLRLAVDLRAYPEAAHGHVLRLADDVGRQVGGWLRALKAKGGGA
ncbi:MAG: four helix bundle protein [Planctomycetes bacterium]|nr:four helix bundle protein [Planctomycetota bacterium]